MSMGSRKRTDLIVPIHDRRRGRRILTTRNVLGCAIVAILAFAAITIRSEMHKPSGDYGRLFGEQVTVAPAAPTAPASIVTEGPPAVNDQTAADPMLLSAGAREQYLGVKPPAATAASPPAPTFVPDAPVQSAPQPTTAGPGRVTIVGGTDGVKLVRENTNRRVLAGGIFKQ
ncbi:MAG: hypothetical protein JWO56_2976 [Acidobacteria bacterium]|nr:hypothetical protein [Acidobacteriota bacterium]